MANMDDMMKNFAQMMQSNQIPDNLKDALNSFVSNSQNNCNDGSVTQSSTNNANGSCAQGFTSNTNSTTNSQNNSRLNFEDFFRNFSNSSNSSGSSDMPNIDINTILKLQQIMSSMNASQNSSGANLLRSLKPYLNPNRQKKVDEYIGLLGIENVMKLMNNSGGDVKNGS